MNEHSYNNDIKSSKSSRTLLHSNKGHIEREYLVFNNNTKRSLHVSQPIETFCHPQLMNNKRFEGILGFKDESDWLKICNDEIRLIQIERHQTKIKGNKCSSLIATIIEIDIVNATEDLLPLKEKVRIVQIIEEDVELLQGALIEEKKKLGDTRTGGSLL
ncbi:hypothetical protein ACLOJK_007395 [Asimina triloba]